MDFLMDLLLAFGFTTVLVVVDMLTKMTHFIPCHGLPTASKTAHLFLQHVFCLHVLPNRWFWTAESSSQLGSGRP